VPTKFGWVGWIIMENYPPPIYTWGRSFLVVMQQSTNHNVEMANQISMKFIVDIICWIETCQTIQLYSPHSQTVLPVSVTCGWIDQYLAYTCASCNGYWIRTTSTYKWLHHFYMLPFMPLQFLCTHFLQLVDCINCDLQYKLIPFWLVLFL